MMIAGYTATQVVLMFNFVLDAVIGLSAVFGASAGMNAVPRKMTRLVSGESHRHTHTCTHTHAHTQLSPSHSLLTIIVLLLLLAHCYKQQQQNEQ